MFVREIIQSGRSIKVMPCIIHIYICPTLVPLLVIGITFSNEKFKTGNLINRS